MRLFLAMSDLYNREISFSRKKIFIRLIRIKCRKTFAFVFSNERYEVQVAYFRRLSTSNPIVSSSFAELYTFSCARPIFLPTDE